MSDNNFFENFASRTDLQEKFGDNALLLVAAEMRLGIDDIDAFAIEYLTDGFHDKKCDLVCLTPEKEKLIIAQGYYTNKEKRSAPANKATDLIAATKWLFSGELEPTANETLYNIAQEVRNLLNNQVIKEVEIWYVHNLNESPAVFSEIQQAANNAKDVLNSNFDLNINIKPIEIGKKTLENDYNRLNTSIYVSSEYEFSINGGFELNQDSWSTYITAISFEDIVNIWGDFDTNLLSPNIRDYLGVIQRETNINNKIAETIATEPENFAIYNNGITVLVNDYRASTDSKSIKVSGIGIVNGGQTTGTIGTSNGKNGQVIARFIKSNDQNLLEKIVRYNNTQNNVKPADFRSSDATQKRLIENFKEVYNNKIIYTGARRGGAGKSVRRSSAQKRKTLIDTTVAQSLAAFHLQPNLAYNKTKMIWEDDQVYVQFFNNETTPGHILFTYSLLKAVEEYKKKLKDFDSPSPSDSKRIEYFSKRGSHIILATAISNSIESLLQERVTDKYSLRFKESVDTIEKAVEIWNPVVLACSAFAQKLTPATATKMGNSEIVSEALSDHLDNIEGIAATGSYNSIAEDFKNNLQ